MKNKMQRLSYSSLNIHQKINFKANLVSYSNTFGTGLSNHIMQCDAIVFDNVISYGKYSQQITYTN